MIGIADDDDQFVHVFEQGRKAARIGAPLTSNPYLDHESIEPAAWADGFHSVYLEELTAVERGRVYLEGKSAAAQGYSASVCAYVNHENPELMEIWLLGYAPHVGD